MRRVRLPEKPEDPEETRRQVPNEVIKELVVKEVPVEAVETMPDPTLVEQDERYEETKGSPPRRRRQNQLQG